MIELAFHYSPTDPIAGRGRVHLWLLDLDGSGPTARRQSILSSEELMRARRLKDPLSRRRAIARFSMARLVLGNASGIPPEDVAFVEGACGKPRIASSAFGSGQAPTLSFNLSHSENVLAVAVAYCKEVGVDVEVLDLSRSSRSFYRTWTLQEASSKLIGVGVALNDALPRRKSFATRSLELTFARKNVILAIAAADTSELENSYRRLPLEKGALLGEPSVR